MESGAPLPVELPGKSLVHIHIHQESSLAYLCQAVGRCWARQQEAASKDRQPSAAAPAPSARGCCGGRHSMPGGVQILLGVVCVSLGVVVDYEHVFYEYFRAGAPYWMGGLFILSGVFSMVGNRCGGPWIPVAAVLNLAGVVAASVALAFGIARIPDLQGFYNYKAEVCRRRADPLRTTLGPGGSDYDWEEENCRELLWHLLAVAFSVRVLLLVFSCIGLGAALCGFANGMWVVCLKARGGAYSKLGDQEEPPAYEDAGRPEALA